MRPLLFSLLLICAVARAEHITVTVAEYGDAWPYTVDQADVFCHQNAVLLDAAGKRYNPTAEEIASRLR